MFWVVFLVCELFVESVLHQKLVIILSAADLTNGGSAANSLIFGGSSGELDSAARGAHDRIYRSFSASCSSGLCLHRTEALAFFVAASGSYR
jgi:hypothetical protein